MLADALPGAVGVNVALIVQLKPGPKVAPQELTMANPAVAGNCKSVTVMPVSVTVPLVFLSVTICGALGVPTICGGGEKLELKVMEVGLNTARTGVPVPERFTGVGLVKFPLKFNCATLGPTPNGRNTTVTVQLVFAGMVKKNVPEQVPPPVVK